MSWAEKSLDQLGYISRGRSKHRPRDAAHLYGGDIPFIQTADVKHANLYIKEYKQTYSDAGLEQSKLWPVGTVCITIAANIADTAILGIVACFPDSVIGFIPDQDKADARFIKYLFDAVLQKRYKTFTQGAAQDNLSQSKLLSLKFLVPDVNLQKRIADVISTYDELIENNQRRIALLEQAARLLYKKWFLRLRFPNYENTPIIDGVPVGWSIRKVSDLGSIITGKTPSTKDETNYGGDIPFVKTPDMHGQTIIVRTEQTLTERGAKSQANKFIPRGSVMVSCIGTVGVVSITSTECQTNQQINSIIFENPKLKYYAFFALSDLKPFLEGMSGGATMGNVNKTKFSNVQVMLPELSVLGEFDELVDPLFKQMEALTLANEKLVSARDLLLPRLMKGEITV